MNKTNDWKHPLPFGDSVWVKKNDVEPLVKAVRKMLDEIYEFGSVVSNEYVELAESAYISLVGYEAVEHSVQSDEIPAWLCDCGYKHLKPYAGLVCSSCGAVFRR